MHCKATSGATRFVQQTPNLQEQQMPHFGHCERLSGASNSPALKPQRGGKHEGAHRVRSVSTSCTPSIMTNSGGARSSPPLGGTGACRCVLVMQQGFRQRE